MTVMFLAAGPLFGLPHFFWSIGALVTNLLSDVQADRWPVFDMTWHVADAPGENFAMTCETVVQW